MLQRTFPITGMSCSACAVSVEQVALKVNGVVAARVNLATHQLWIEFDESKLNVDELTSSIHHAGYEVLIVNHQVNPFDIRKQNYIRQRNKTLITFLLAIPLMIIGMVEMHSLWSKWITLILATPVVFIMGWSFHQHAFRSLLTFRLGMDALVSISSLTAYFYSFGIVLYESFFSDTFHSHHIYAESAAMIIAFILLGKTLEEKAKFQASVSLQNMMDLQVKKAVVLKDNEEIELPVEFIQPGDQVLVKEKSLIPVDGIVLREHLVVDESMLTGEAIPVNKKNKDKVYAGTMNLSASVVITASETGKKTLLAQMVKRIEMAQGTKAPVQQLVDKISSVFVPVILVISILTFTGWWLITANIEQAVYSTIAVLIIACPCAMGLATPTALVAGIGRAAEKGIIVRNAESLQRAHQIDTVIFDKTGTLTIGKPSVSEIKWLNEKTESKISLLYTMELHADHPVAYAIANYCKKLGAVRIPDLELETISGKGAKSNFENEDWFVGNASLFNPDLVKKVIDELSFNGNIFFGTYDSIVAVIEVKDQLRNESKFIVEQLKKNKIEPVLASGDQLMTVKDIANQLNIEKYYASLLPHDKAQLIKNFQSENKKVAMVGDGVNDAESMAMADVSIAMGSGSDITIQVADITIISSDLRKISDALKISTLTMRVIQQNLFWAFIYNILAIPLAAGLFYPFTGWQLNPMIAAIAMTFSSITVVLNSLRLKYVK
jgi:Cu2+-exporting ATPase